MTEQGTGLPSPIGPSRLSLLKGNCQISEPKWRQEGSFLPFLPLFFLLFLLCLALAIMLSLVLVASGNSRWEGEHYPRFFFFFLFFFPRRLSDARLWFLSSVGHLGAPCVASSPTIPNSPTILFLVNGRLWWPINTGRLGMGFSITKVVPQHCNPPPPFLPRTFVRRQKIQYINSFYQHWKA